MPKSRGEDLWLVILSLMSVPGIYLLNTALLQNWSSDWGVETAGILPVESGLLFFLEPDNFFFRLPTTLLKNCDECSKCLRHIYAWFLHVL